MVDQEEGIDKSGQDNIEIDKDLVSEDLAKKEELTTLFAVRTTINQESNILKQIFYTLFPLF